MKKYMVMSYMSTEAMLTMKERTQDDRQDTMAAWMTWKENYSEHVIDMGAPLFGGVTVKADGKTTPSDKNVAGYMIIAAETLDQAITLLQKSPLFDYTDGCDIELHELY